MVPAAKRIVCLANSRKLAGRCIAGREWTPDEGVGNWVRPVSARTGQEVSEYERQYEDGSDPKVLDIINVPVIEPKPEAEGAQTENWLLDPEFYWRKEGAYSWFDLPVLVDPIEPLWVDGHNTYNGVNDKIPMANLKAVSSSLRLLHLDRLELKVFAPGEAFGNSKRRVQGQFTHARRDYALWVTDPVHERAYLAKLDGSYEIGECYLTINLGEEYDGFRHKLIAAIIECAGANGRARR